jgi:glycerol-3-phosphate cytidylyltransferase
MKKGITASTFDLLHTGHIIMLKEAKEVCDYLICALHVDPSIERPEKNKPIQSLYERYIQLQSVKYVDEIIPYETENELLTILQSNQIDIRIIGEDYYDKSFTGRDIEEIKIHFNKRKHNYSSTDLRNRIKNSK